MITCVYSIELRPVELALEQLRGAANAAERVLDLVREAADQLAVRLLLLVQPLLARDLQLLVDVAEFEQQRGVRRVDRRNRARQVQLRLAADAELELLLGVRRTRCDGALDRRASAAQSPNSSASVWPTSFCRDSSNRFSAAGFA